MKAQEANHDDATGPAARSGKYLDRACDLDSSVKSGNVEPSSPGLETRAALAA
jgi:hypothetical protein